MAELFGEKEMQKSAEKIVTANNYKFEEDIADYKEIYTIYGDKGSGKTTFAMSFPGTIAVLSFDHKSSLIKRNMYKNDQRIKVYDAAKYYDEDVSNCLISAKLTYENCCHLLKDIKDKINPDYVLIDGFEIFSKIAENVMRFNNKISPFGGIVNQNVWKERRLYIRELHKLSREAAKKGVIYTTYTDKEEIIEDGSVKTRKNIPRWVDVVLWETDCLIHTFNDSKDGKAKFCIEVMNNKLNNEFKTGEIKEVKI